MNWFRTGGKSIRIPAELHFPVVVALVAGACQRQPIGPVGQPRARESSGACKQRIWSAPAPLLTPPASRRSVARNPSIAADANDVYIVGNDVPFLDKPVRVGETFTAWRVGHGSIGAPAADRAFVSPKAVLDSSGRLHVVWAEPAALEPVIPPYHWMLLQASSLWSAEYQPDSGWSSPTLIYSGPVVWTGVMRGTVGGGEESENLIAAPIEGGGALVVDFSGGRWSATPVPIRPEPAYVSVLGLGTKRLLAVVKADTTQTQDRNSVFLYEQRADGPWRLASLVQHSGTQPAMEVKLLKGTGGRVHMIWRQMLREDYFVIRHASSDDGGESFSNPSDLPSGGLIRGVDAATDDCGRVHVVYEDWSGGMDAVRIGYATWDGVWSKPQRLFPTYTAGELALARRTNGSLMLAFLGSNSVVTDKNPEQMMFAELR